MKTLISGATIVNEGKLFRASLIVENEVITHIIEDNNKPCGVYDESVDATGCFVLPGVIDEHVHFREPGLTAKADMESESRAAAFGGVTSVFDMPNTIPQVTTIDVLNKKFDLARQKCHVNYSFFYGATNGNASSFAELDIHRIPGIKLFMGSSTGNMLVDKMESLQEIFRTTPLPLMTHCEDTAQINENMRLAKLSHGADPDIHLHELIRSENACYDSTLLAVSLAKVYGTRLHVAHISTAKELELFGEFKNITAEAVIAHLFFTNHDYDSLGALIKCNPSIKSTADRDALRDAISNGKIYTIGTDHAPHRIEEKQGGCCKASSGMPIIQFSLVTMLELVDLGVLTIERLVELMCHHPAMLFEVRKRGFIRQGYKADLTIVRPHAPWRVVPEVIQSKCKWSPMLNHEFKWRVEHTFCNGQHIYNNGAFSQNSLGEEIVFR